MTRVKGYIGSVYAVAAFSLVGGVALRAQEAPPGDALNGKRVYVSTGCYMCHGRAGQGGAYNGVAPPLAKTAMPWEGFKFQLRSPASDMPAYTELVMTEKEIGDIYAFLQSLPGRRDLKDMPIFAD
jgi:mono/diheme cytochrome c family protein